MQAYQSGTFYPIRQRSWVCRTALCGITSDYTLHIVFLRNKYWSGSRNQPIEDPTMSSIWRRVKQNRWSENVDKKKHFKKWDNVGLGDSRNFITLIFCELNILIFSINYCWRVSEVKVRFGQSLSSVPSRLEGSLFWTPIFKNGSPPV